MIKIPYVKDEAQAAKLAEGSTPFVGMSALDGCWYGGTEEELKRAGCVNVAPAGGENEKTSYCIAPDLAAELVRCRALLEQAVNEEEGYLREAGIGALPWYHAARKYLEETEG